MASRRTRIQSGVAAVGPCGGKAGGERRQQLGFRPGEVEPCQSVSTVENDIRRLIVDRHDVRAGIGCSLSVCCPR